MWKVMVVLSFTAITAGANPQPASSQDKLKSAVIDAEKKLPPLEPWQKKIFDEEVLAHPSRFISDYKATGNQMEAQIDLPQLRNYLVFYGPKMLKGEGLGNFQILAYIKVPAQCASCLLSVDPIRKLAQARMERRGFTPLWVSPAEVGDPSIQGKALGDRLAELAQSRKAAGSWVLEWRPAEADTIDAAHADEQNWVTESHLSLRMVGKIEHKLDFQTDETFESSVEKLMSDAMTEVGTKAEQKQIGQGSSGREELLVEFTGLRSFEHLGRAKAFLADGFKDVALFEERKVTRGKVAFALKSQKSRAELYALLVQAASRTTGIDLRPESNASQAIEVGIKP